MASFGATGCNTTRARCGMVSQAIIILSYPHSPSSVPVCNVLQAAVDADAVFPLAMTETQSSSGSLPPSFPSLTDCICSYPMMNFTLAIWQLPFPCFCRIQYYFEIASFPPCKAFVRAQVRSGGLLCPSLAGQEESGRQWWLACALLMRKLACQNLHTRSLLPFTQLASMYPTPFVFFRIVARHKTTPTRRRHSRRRRLC
jgi:hypothetical protein